MLDLGNPLLRVFNEIVLNLHIIEAIVLYLLGFIGKDAINQALDHRVALHLNVLRVLSVSLRRLPVLGTSILFLHLLWLLLLYHSDCDDFIYTIYL